MWQGAKNVYHLGVAILANLLFGFPGKKLTVIGVTGTDGKTTTTNLIFHVLQTAGKSVSMVSTVGANIHGKKSSLGFHVTTPSPFQIQKFLANAGKHNGEENYVILEVSSHSIDQQRVWGIPFTVGVITNVTNEHLDYHKTYDKYLRTKAKLLQRANIAVVNYDDSSYEQLQKLLPKQKMITYGLSSKAQVHDAYQSNLIGEFNTYNVLAAVAVCRYFHIPEGAIKKGIASFQSPSGRMNTIPNKKGLTIIVDYAHTPNGLQQALRALQSRKQKGSKIIALVGAEGKRDPGKRRRIGEIAKTLSDIVIITAVDPRGENDRINQEILDGAETVGGIHNKTVFVEADRAKAIQFAINSLAKKGDIVGLFGKGHERSMNYDGKNEIPWSDTEEVERVLNGN